MIRAARIGDWPALKELWAEVDGLHAALVPAYFRAAEPGFAHPRSELARILDAATETVLVAEAGARVAGFVLVRLYDAPAQPNVTPGRRGQVEELVVAEGFRRRGIGTALMREVAEWARARGAGELVLTVWRGNEEARRFYERLGYRTLSRVLHLAL